MSREKMYKDFKGNWKQAVHEGVSILVENNCATFELEKAILKVTKDLGPYYILTPGLALQHAPLGSYCKKPNVSLLFSQEPIIYDENNSQKWAKIIFTLSATDQDSHMKYIQQFGNLFGSDENLKYFLDSDNVEDLLKRIKDKGGEIW